MLDKIFLMTTLLLCVGIIMIIVSLTLGDVNLAYIGLGIGINSIAMIIINRILDWVRQVQDDWYEL